MKSILHITLVLVFTALWAHGAADSIDGFKRITSHPDVQEFAGCIVAYKTDSYHLGSTKGYPIDSDKSVKYGYIMSTSLEWPTGEQGYHLTRFLGPTDIGGYCALTNSKLKGKTLLLRHVTEEEWGKMKKAVHFGGARFEHTFSTEQALAKLFSQESTHNIE